MEFAKSTLRKELASTKSETPYHVALNIQLAFEKKKGGKWVCVLQTNSSLGNCFWVEDDIEETYVEMHAKDIVCALWKVRRESAD